MTSSFLRKFRILFSAIVLICSFLIFVDYKSLIPEKYIGYFLYLQFVPSAIKFCDLREFAVYGFVIVLLLTLVTGRTYCSFLCPLGIGQDLFSRIGGRIRKKYRRFGYKKPFTVIRYSILTITLVVTIIWGTYMVTLLDPYSIFGRFMTFFGKPLILWLNNFLETILSKFDIYFLSKIKVSGYQSITYLIPLVFLLLVGTLSLTKGRLYCNMICPVGTLLGFLSKISLFRIKFDEGRCTRCGRCSIGCKSSCIDFLRYDVDVSRCVNCFNCIDLCPDKALSFGLTNLSKKQDDRTDISKRRFIASSVLFLLGLPRKSTGQEIKTPVPQQLTTIKELKTCPVCPPGAGSIHEFNELCTACSLCISACPDKVLQPAFKEYGLIGFMQPVMNYHKGFCTYNCTVCTEICPTNALKPLLPEAKKLTQIGKVVFIKDNCIVKTEKTACGACSESCPTKAVFMVPYEGNLLIPETNQDICIGCGHCEFSCPTIPYKAIFVDGNPVHQTAEKPEIIETEMESPEDFPF